MPRISVEILFQLKAKFLNFELESTLVNKQEGIFEQP